MGVKHWSRKREFQLQVGARLRVYKGMGCENRKGKVAGYWFSIFTWLQKLTSEDWYKWILCVWSMTLVSSTEREEIDEDEFQSVAALDGEVNFLLGRVSVFILPFSSITGLCYPAYCEVFFSDLLIHICTAGWTEAISSKVSCLRKQHDPMQRLKASNHRPVNHYITVPSNTQLVGPGCCLPKK